MFPFHAALALLALAVPQISSRLPKPMTLRFAVIGDYGNAGPAEAAVAALVAGWNPDIVVTVGDNNYLLGQASTIDANIGQYYSAFIYPYLGSYGPGATENRFFPCLGNHDWYTPGAAPYLAYFTLPGNERYYDFVRGPVHFFALDSDANEPNGITNTSGQAQWLQGRMSASRSPFDIVFFHHSPYSSSATHGSQVNLQWPFRDWGADLVLTGHDHDYERVVREGFPYLVNGLGGFSPYRFSHAPVAGSASRFDLDRGAILGEANDETATLSFVTQAGIVIDTFTLPAHGVDRLGVPLVADRSVWRYKDDGSDQGTSWRAIAFDDSAWSAGPAQLGYGDGDEATLVGYGPDPNHRYITTWFRRAFEVPNPSDIRRLALEVLRDDGAVVYLNGTEVFRTNLREGPIGAFTPATVSVNTPEEDAFWSTDVDPGLLHAGRNVLAVEVHQASATSSDVSFDLKLLGTLAGAVLSPRGATWSYRDTGVDPGPTWTSPGFDDSTWASGPAQLGYGDGDEATVVGFGIDPLHKYATTWFRRSFTVSNPDDFRALVLRLLRDDGAAVYLNGTEIYRGNLPQTGLSSASTAGYDIEGADETEFVETFANARLLVAGTNVLAVEIHQFDGQSPDLSFDLELAGL
jgi:tartrate-resistant acid phosphatase type 5